MNIKILIPSVLLIVFISGCIQAGPSMGGSGGVVIEAFEPDFADVYSGEQVQLRLFLRNTGSRDATNIETKLTIFGKIVNDFCNEDKLLSADPERGILGETKSCTYTVKEGAPKLPEKLSVVYTPSVRVEYGYSSFTVKSIAVASYKELRKIKDVGGNIPTETISSTTSPVSINIVAKGPVRIYGKSIKFPIEVVVSNVGGGVVCMEKCSEDNWNKLTINIKSLSNILTIEECKKETIPLFKGKTNTIGCKISIENPGTPGPIEALIQASAEYNYFVDATTQIKVTGRVGGEYVTT